MTIKEYRESLKKLDGRFKPSNESGRTLSEIMLDECDIWSNDACRGYAIEAAKRAGFKDEQIRALIREFSGVFGDFSVKDAEQKYMNF